MKKILFYFRGIYSGGTEAAAYTLSSMIKDDYELYFTYFDKEYSDVKAILKMKKMARYIPFEQKFSVDTIIFCTQAINEFDIIKNTFTYNNSFYLYHYSSEKQNTFLEMALNGVCDKIICVSNTSKNDLERLPFVNDNNKNKIIVINNVIDIERILSIADNDIEYDFSHTLNLVTVARIAPEKRLDRVINIANELEKRNIDYIWLIIGKVNELNCTEYEKNIQNLFSSHSNIIFTGEKDNPFKYLKKADYTLLLSDKETWGLVITESKIVGTPCVVTNFEAAYEQVEDGINGLILDMNNENYEYIVNQMLDNKEILKSNIKNFKYDNLALLDKWKNIL